MERLARTHGPFDAVFSRWTAEHVRDGERFHRHVFELLRPGGTAVHMFPTLYALPFLVNRVLPPALSSGVLFRACPARHAKFRPYYSWCRGPSRAQLARLRSVGFSIERYTGYFGHAFYRRIKPLAAAERAFVGVMVDHPLPALTSFALVVLRRPPESPAVRGRRGRRGARRGRCCAGRRRRRRGRRLTGLERAGGGARRSARARS